MISAKDIVGYESKKDFRSAVLEEVLKMFSKKAMVKLVKLPSKKKTTKKAIPSTIDSESDKIIHELIKGNFQNLEDINPINGKIIKPLYLFLDKEVLLYAELKNLKFSKAKKRADSISNFVDELEKKHLEVKWAVVKGMMDVE